MLPEDVDCSLHPNRVFYLDGDRMHSSIQKVPALVLDCEPDIDFSRGIKAKQEYACQVAEFFEFVKKKKEVYASNVGKDAVKMNQPTPVLIPHHYHGNFWMPAAQSFPDSALSSLDFRQAKSFMSQ